MAMENNTIKIKLKAQTETHIVCASTCVHKGTGHAWKEMGSDGSGYLVSTAEGERYGGDQGAF